MSCVYLNKTLILVSEELINYLQENMYSLLGKVKEAKRLFIQEGHHDPTKEEIAERVGITIEKLQRLLLHTRMPLSMQQPVWADQDTTFQVVFSYYVDFLLGVQIPSQSGIVTSNYCLEHTNAALGSLKFTYRSKNTRTVGKPRVTAKFNNNY